MNNQDWMNVPWHQMSADRWLKFVEMAENDFDIDLLVAMIHTAFRGSRYSDPRVVRRMMTMADMSICPPVPKQARLRVPEETHNPLGCPYRHIQIHAMKALVMSIFSNIRHEDRARIDPKTVAPYKNDDGTLIPELIDFVVRNATNLTDFNNGAFRDPTRSFLRWMYNGGVYRTTDPYPLLVAMITFDLAEKIVEPDQGVMIALRQIYRRNDKPGSHPTASRDALRNSDNPLSQKAAERYVVLRAHAFSQPRTDSDPVG